MISVNVRTSTTRRAVSTDITATPKSVFAELDIDTSTSSVVLDGARLTASDYVKSFEELGVTDGSTVTMSAIVKADGATN
jgi:hypothetical protein